MFKCQGMDNISGKRKSRNCRFMYSMKCSHLSEQKQKKILETIPIEMDLLKDKNLCNNCKNSKLTYSNYVQTRAKQNW